MHGYHWPILTAWLQPSPHQTMEMDLTQSEEELLSNMSKTCRWTIKKGQRTGW